MACCATATSPKCKNTAIAIAVVGVAAAVGAYFVYKYRSGAKLLVRPKNGFLSSKNDPAKPVVLIKKEVLTHDVRLFRFQIGDGQTLGILPGEHIKASAQINSKNLSRFYSPVSDPHQTGYFEIIVKIYSPTDDNPDAGTFTRYLDSLKIGDQLSINGPFGGLGYLSNGAFLVKNKDLKKYKTVAMIAGGSGLTPMLQLIRHVMHEDLDQSPKLHLIYTNKTRDDVIVADELKNHAKTNPSKFNLTHAFTRVNDEGREDPKLWVEHIGRIEEGLLARVFPYPSDDVLVLICGPKAMNATAKTLCTTLGYSNISIF